MPRCNGTAWLAHSASQRTLGPIHVSNNHWASQVEARGNAGFTNRERSSFEIFKAILQVARPSASRSWFAEDYRVRRRGPRGRVRVEWRTRIEAFIARPPFVCAGMDKIMHPDGVPVVIL